MALKLVFQQKQITVRCSIVFSIRIHDTDKTDKLLHVVNMYLTVNGLSRNLVCAGKRVIGELLQVLWRSHHPPYVFAVMLQNLPDEPCIMICQLSLLSINIDKLPITASCLT